MYTYTKPQLFFTAVMCLGMGSLMSGINIALRLGLTAAGLHAFLAGWLPTILVATTWNLVVAAPLTNLLIRQFATTPEHLIDQAKAVKIHQWAIIIIMCLSMSTWGLLTAGALPGIPVSALLFTWARSFTLAYVIRALVVRPAAAALSRRVFPGNNGTFRVCPVISTFLAPPILRWHSFDPFQIILAHWAPPSGRFR
ncbi:hypothetical protein ACFQ3L_03940 [Lacticaseibacillus jixianensis]|uniref:DUF2798 domain-containing protein n=1 Tax=Lacticaseibacillus jixianensis TaxID=2486012 RepID=A0ABW4B984_9LACO|nr:hypothetical protein [Lacticaseibacillus jixianensis]